MAIPKSLLARAKKIIEKAERKPSRSIYLLNEGDKIPEGKGILCIILSEDGTHTISQDIDGKTKGV